MIRRTLSRLFLLLALTPIGCATAHATWTAAELDLSCECRMVKPAGQDIPRLVCATNCALPGVNR